MVSPSAAGFPQTSFSPVFSSCFSAEAHKNKFAARMRVVVVQDSEMIIYVRICYEDDKQLGTVPVGGVKDFSPRNHLSGETDRRRWRDGSWHWEIRRISPTRRKEGRIFQKGFFCQHLSTVRMKQRQLIL